MKNFHLLFLICCLVLFSFKAAAQTFIDAKKIGTFGKDTIEKFVEVNALLLLPKGFSEVTYPELPDSLNSLLGLNGKEVDKIWQQREKVSPLLGLSSDIKIQKDDIFIAYRPSWIRLSSYYEYNNENLSAEAYRQKLNNSLGDLRKQPRYYPSIKLLEIVSEKTASLIHADTIFVFENQHTWSYKSSEKNYESLIFTLVKVDLGVIIMQVFYPKGAKDRAIKEVNQAWGMIRFKPDAEFTHPDRFGWTSKPTEPELYFGKFSFLNNPDQVKRAEEKYALKKVRQQSNKIASEGSKLVLEGKVPEGKLKFDEAIQIDPKNPNPYTHLFFIYLDEKDEAKTWDNWEKLKNAGTNLREVIYFKGLAFNKYGQLDSASYQFLKVLQEVDSIDFRNYLQLANIEIGKQNPVAAEAYFKQGITVFEKEMARAAQKQSHRVLNINMLFDVKYAYAKWMMFQEKPAVSRKLMEEILEADAENQRRLEQRDNMLIYGRLIPKNLAESNFLLGLISTTEKDDLMAKFYFEQAQKNGKVIPADLERFIK